MEKWYENAAVDKDIIVSSRVRLARNLKKHIFPPYLSTEGASQLTEEVKQVFEREPISPDFQYISVYPMDKMERRRLMERHIISPEMAAKDQPCGVFVNDKETESILINEEDHIRIQSLEAGNQLDMAFQLADQLDDAVENRLDYAFHERFGYLTSCPTNTGTGLRASYMMHLPALETSGQIRNIIQAVSKLGIAVRGIYGEGSEAFGSLYQFSNQTTLGKSEKEILQHVKNICNIVKEQEERMKERFLKELKYDFEDKIYRSYGILTTARKITAKEAMGHLSNVREGFLLGVLQEKKPEQTIYSIMMNIQPGSLQNQSEKGLEPFQRDTVRASYLRKQFQS